MDTARQVQRPDPHALRAPGRIILGNPWWEVLDVITAMTTVTPVHSTVHANNSQDLAGAGNPGGAPPRDRGKNLAMIFASWP